MTAYVPPTIEDRDTGQQIPGGRVLELRTLIEAAARHERESREGAPGWATRTVRDPEDVTRRETYVPDDERQGRAADVATAELRAFAHGALEAATALLFYLPSAHGPSDAETNAKRVGQYEVLDALEAWISYRQRVRAGAPDQDVAADLDGWLNEQRQRRD